jgi:DNA-directed RNA polymerase specialized sigma subunit
MNEDLKEYKLIKAYLKDIKDSLKKQQGKVEDILVLLHRLFQMEILFSKKLRASGPGRKVYFKFIRFINRIKGGIKTARSYFRARQEIFKDTVNVAIRTNNPSLMHNIPINFQFCSFAMKNIDRVNKDGKEVNVEIIKELSSFFEGIKKLRDEIITKHLYLSLSKAKVFGSTFKSMEFEDLIQVANMGLVSAVDKYVHETDISSFHQVAIGKITAALISDGDNYADVTIGVNDRKKLYTIRKFLQVNPDATAEHVADSLEMELDLVSDLIMATKKRSLDEFVGENQEVRAVDLTSYEDQEDPLELVEKKDTLSKIDKVYEQLTLLEKKVLILKGINLGDFA